MGHTDQISSEKGLVVRDLLDLSVAELLILQYLLRYNSPIQRKVLLETLNYTMGDNKAISSSSFYNMTKKLTERDFISADKETNSLIINAMEKFKGENKNNNLSSSIRFPFSTPSPESKCIINNSHHNDGITMG